MGESNFINVTVEFECDTKCDLGHVESSEFQNSRHHQVKLYYIHSIIILMNERIPCMCVILEPIQSTSRIKTVLVICIQFCLNLLDYFHQINLVEKAFIFM